MRQTLLGLADVRLVGDDEPAITQLRRVVGIVAAVTSGTHP